MKTYLLAIGFLGVFCSTAFSQSAAESELYERLFQEGPDSVKALEDVLKRPNEYSALILYSGALVAFTEERLEDSGFLLYAARLRADFDKECFPPKGTGGDSPFVALAAVDYTCSICIPSALMAEPKAFEKSLARLKAWAPKASKDYDPGYEFTERKSEKEAQEAVKAARTEFITGMTGAATLLNDTEYFAAFRIVQAYNSGLGDKRPTKQAYEKAVGTMKRIEEDEGIEGFAAVLDDSRTVEAPQVGTKTRAVRCLDRTARKRRGERGRGLPTISSRRRCACLSMDFAGGQSRFRCATIGTVRRLWFGCPLSRPSYCAQTSSAATACGP